MNADARIAALRERLPTLERDENGRLTQESEDLLVNELVVLLDQARRGESERDSARRTLEVEAQRAEALQKVADGTARALEKIRAKAESALTQAVVDRAGQPRKDGFP